VEDVVKRPTAREQETVAAAAPLLRSRRVPVGFGEVGAMLIRRGFRPMTTEPDLPFPSALDEGRREGLLALLGHYAFRLFLRGAIQRPDGFLPAEATRYVDAARAGAMAEELRALDLAEELPGGRYRLARRARSFGGTLEWYVAEELRRRFAFDVAAGVKLQGARVGGDLDVIAVAEGRLVYLELSSSPPRHMLEREVKAFFDRLKALRPDLALFVIDTALRLSDKIVPMLREEIARRTGATPPRARRVVREVWGMGPRLYAVNAKADLMRNIARALADGLREAAPDYP
jgi:hypothetical protein